ncbi:ATP-binding protein [Pelagicoccus sp. SDUM812005]|uniref:ATP-binding protein n=1 Tax=Pelagicoccus sp. SDUM812005 TaxID=3041257 RepID=UPI00280CEDFF|nr:ATP-binding protein [Pelagicoccus sp. SDUM812005]MDQ8180370.1 ATP-binding protein [Pelagicoccus sp. SDUM812005]
MIFLVGVSRVGKTTLAREIYDDYNNRGPNAIYFNCPPRQTNFFTYKPFLVSYLKALGDPFAESRVRERTTQDLSLKLITKRIKEQNVKLVIIDEADLFISLESTRQTYANLQFLKNLMNITQVPHMFVGTGHLTKIIALDGQVINRSHVLHFKPYSAHNEKERKVFSQALTAFLKETSLELCEDLRKDAQHIFDATNGCIGALKELLVRCEAVASEFEISTVTKELIKQVNPVDPYNQRPQEIDEVRSFFARSRAPDQRKESSKGSRRPGKRKKPEDELGARP